MTLNTIGLYYYGVHLLPHKKDGCLNVYSIGSALLAGKRRDTFSIPLTQRTCFLFFFHFYSSPLIYCGKGKHICITKCEDKEVKGGD